MKVFFLIALVTSVYPAFASEDPCLQIKNKIYEHPQTMYTTGGVKQYNKAISNIREAEKELEEAVQEYTVASNNYVKYGVRKTSDMVSKISQAKSKERTAVLKLIQAYQSREEALQKMIRYENTLLSFYKQAESNSCTII